MVVPLNAELKHEGSSELRAHEVRIPLEASTHELIEREATELDVSVEELARFAVLYYLADRDSGRIARRLPVLLSADRAHPLDELLDD
jgi:hypothetical protein